MERGSGFFAKDRTEPIEAIETSLGSRLAPYREAISVAQTVLAQHGLPRYCRFVALLDAERQAQRALVPRETKLTENMT